MQSIDPEDPWLQLEWGEILVSQNRKPEAALHLSVGAMMLAKVFEASIMVETSAGAQGRDTERPSRILSLQGEGGGSGGAEEGMGRLARAFPLAHLISLPLAFGVTMAQATR